VLGRFLEFSVATPDIRDSLDFYTKLGFTQAETGDAWPHPYAVVTDGRICLGLHQYTSPAPSMTFVKPGLLKHLDALEDLGVQFEFRHLGNDVFNEVGWFDPSGHLISLIEARTFSPSKRPALDTSLCGYFLEIALPTPVPTAAKAYWERLGFVGIDEPDDRLPHVSCTSDTIDLGLYDPAHLRGSALRFEVDDAEETLARLADIGIVPAEAAASRRSQSPGTVLNAPEGTQLLLTEAPEA
jgi:catechol 2,3-dioxygenase-like lactoylglutathione lyase family enzyme